MVMPGLSACSNFDTADWVRHHACRLCNELFAWVHQIGPHLQRAFASRYGCQGPMHRLRCESFKSIARRQPVRHFPLLSATFWLWLVTMRRRSNCLKRFDTMSLVSCPFAGYTLIRTKSSFCDLSCLLTAMVRNCKFAG